MSPPRLLSLGFLALSLVFLLSGLAEFFEVVRYTYQCIRYDQLHRLFSPLLVAKLGWTALVMSSLAFAFSRPTLRAWLNPWDNEQPMAPRRRPIADGVRKEGGPTPSRENEPRPHPEKRGPGEDRRTQEADDLRKTAEWRRQRDKEKEDLEAFLKQQAAQLAAEQERAAENAKRAQQEKDERDARLKREAAHKRAEKQHLSDQEKAARVRAAQLAAESAKERARAERIAAREAQKAADQAAEQKRAAENEKRTRIEELLEPLGLPYSSTLTMKEIKAHTRHVLLSHATKAQKDGTPDAPDPQEVWLKLRDAELELEQLLPPG